MIQLLVLPNSFFFYYHHECVLCRHLRNSGTWRITNSNSSANNIKNCFQQWFFGSFICAAKNMSNCTSIKNYKQLHFPLWCFIVYAVNNKHKQIGAISVQINKSAHQITIVAVNATHSQNQKHDDKSETQLEKQRRSSKSGNGSANLETEQQIRKRGDESGNPTADLQSAQRIRKRDSKSGNATANPETVQRIWKSDSESSIGGSKSGIGAANPEMVQQIRKCDRESGNKAANPETRHWIFNRSSESGDSTVNLQSVQ